MANAQDSRCDFIDLLKGIGICLVVWGHTMMPRSIYIYSFHMPLFFFLSGYIHKTKPLGQFVLRKLNTLYVPYVVFTLVSWLFYLARHLIDQRQEMLTAHLWKLTSLFTGIADNGGNNPIWFLTCILVVSIFYLIVSGLTRKPLALWGMIFFASLVGYWLSLNNISFYFNIDIAFTGIVFYHLGFVTQQKELLAKLYNLKKPSILIVLGIAEILHIVTAFLNPRLAGIHWVNMAGNTLGNYFLFYLSAGLGVFVFVTIGYWIRKIAFINYLGMNSLLILATHKLLLLLLNDYFYTWLDTGSLWYGLLLSILVVLFSVPFIRLVNLKLPGITGKQPLFREGYLGVRLRV